jgi:glycerol-3-phosphate acyltransferase PlsY
VLLTDNQYAAPLSLLCAVCGTCYSLFLRGRGGRGTTAAFWGLGVLSPLACCVMLLLVLICLKIPDPRQLLKRIRILAIPVVLHLVEGSAALTVCGSLMAGLFLFSSFTRKDDFRHYGILKNKNGK